MTSASIYMGAFAFAAVLIENILRSTQSKNVAAGYTKAVFFTGGLMTLCDGVVMTIIATGGLEMLPYTVTASAIGWIVGVKLHDRLTAKHRAIIKAERHARKKAKREARTRKAISKELRKYIDLPGVQNAKTSNALTVHSAGSQQ